MERQTRARPPAAVACTDGARVAPAATLEGVVERIVYTSPESGWTVARLAAPGRASTTAVGRLIGVQVGESVRLSGRWVQDRRWGEQFAVDGCTTLSPATLAGIERYLASGLVPGVGAVMAERLVARFGLETLEVIDRQPERLEEVPGIGPVRSRRIRAAWAEHRAVKEIMIFLQGHGVSTAHAVRIYRTYRDRAAVVLQENPYRIVLDVPGIGFRTADRIAAALGVERTSPRRAAAGVLHVLEELAGEGHTYAPRAVLLARAAALLAVPPERVATALDELAASGLVIVAPLAAPAGAVVAPADEPEEGSDGAPGAGGPVGGTAGPPAPEAAVALASLHVAETGAAERLAALLAAPGPPAPDPAALAGALAAIERARGLTLDPAQRAAITAACAARILVVTGGPGTGKTTLLNAALDLLSGVGRRVRLCAPTGRAARRLAAATGREAATLHRLLEFSPQSGGFERDRARPLDADVVVVDESSMVDAPLFAHLVQALRPGCQLVLVGDADQLPSVGPGSVLRDVIRSDAVEVVRLTRIFRQAERSMIVVNAHRVRAGETLLPAREDGEQDFFFVERDDPEDVLATLRTVVVERVPRRFGLDPVRDVQVLSPMHRGLLGAANLNAELQALLNPGVALVTRGARSFRLGDKVMQLRNDYDRDVYNGDIGQVVGHDAEEDALIVRFDGRDVRVETADLDQLTLAYACSIHKAQGSEYPAVVLPLHTQHFVMLWRNLLYTALTRARRLVVVIGSRRALALAIRRRDGGRRWTRLGEHLAVLNRGAGETSRAAG